MKQHNQNPCANDRWSKFYDHNSWILFIEIFFLNTYAMSQICMESAWSMQLAVGFVNNVGLVIRFFGPAQ